MILKRLWWVLVLVLGAGCSHRQALAPTEGADSSLQGDRSVDQLPPLDRGQDGPGPPSWCDHLKEVVGEGPVALGQLGQSLFASDHRRVVLLQRNEPKAEEDPAPRSRLLLLDLVEGSQRELYDPGANHQHISELHWVPGEEALLLKVDKMGKGEGDALLRLELADGQVNTWVADLGGYHLSADAERLIVVRKVSGAASRLERIDTRDGAVKVLYEAEDLHLTSVSATAEWITFSAGGHFYLLGENGDDLPIADQVYFPSGAGFLPNGLLVFARGTWDDMELMALSPAEGRVYSLAKGRYPIDFQLPVSAGGDRILATDRPMEMANPDLRPRQLYMIRTDGSGEELLAKNFLTDWNFVLVDSRAAQFTSSGSQVVYLAQREEHPELMPDLVLLGEEGERQVLTHQLRSYRVSPRFDDIYLQQGIAGSAEELLLRSGPDGLHQLTTLTFAYAVDVLPDGQGVLFWDYIGSGQRDLRYVSRDGQTARTLTSLQPGTWGGYWYQTDPEACLLLYTRVEKTGDTINLAYLPDPTNSP